MSTFLNNGINLIYFCDLNGKVVWGKIYDLENEEPIHLPLFPEDRLPNTHPLINFNMGDGTEPLSEIAVKGVINTNRGLMLISSRPILNSENEGPVRGSLIMGKFLNDHLLKTFADQTHVDFSIIPVQTNSLSDSSSEILEGLSNEEPHFTTFGADGALDTYTAFSDIKDQKAFLIKSSLPRKISARGILTIQFAIYFTFAAGFVVLLVMLLLLQLTVLRPLSKLTDHTLSVGETGDLSARITLKQKDEIGTLANELNKMLAQLEKKTGELEFANTSLKDEIAERRRIEKDLQKTIADLEKALHEIKTLRGILPICASCKNVRDDKGYWRQIESYISSHSSAEFSHSICPECAKKLYPDMDIK